MSTIPYQQAIMRLHAEFTESDLLAPAWLLRGDTGRELTCQITRGVTGQWKVTLSLGSERMLSEGFLDHDAAVQGAERLKAGLVTKGWIPVRISASRPTVALSDSHPKKFPMGGARLEATLLGSPRCQ